ncbi:MAG: carboxylating nicotinate-nucleotide diphosphorylase [Pseudomonadota bacterium]
MPSFPLRLHWVAAQVASSLMEDIGAGDLSAQLVPAKKTKAYVITREACTVCGQPWFNLTFSQIDPLTQIEWHVYEGQTVPANTLLCTLTGLSAALLTAERTALNFLQTLSGTATLVRNYVEAISGTDTQIVDTRKTLPGLRHAQKYAVWIAGGTNHRHGLYDGILLKENHILAAGGITSALNKAFAVATHETFIQIEVETLAQLEEALKAGAKWVLLDNFDLAGLREAVQQNSGRAILEASGNVSFSTVRAVAETGVNRISIGSLTKHVHAIDLSMRFQE